MLLITNMQTKEGKKILRPIIQIIDMIHSISNPMKLNDWIFTEAQFVLAPDGLQFLVVLAPQLNEARAIRKYH